MEQSPWVRGACLVLLLVFILICGVHLAGIHHDSDSDGLGLVDGISIILLAAVLGFALIALSRWRRDDFSEAGPVAERDRPSYGCRRLLFPDGGTPSLLMPVVVW